MNNVTAAEPRRLEPEVQGIRHELMAMSGEITAVLPEEMRVEEFRRVVLNAIQERPELVGADRQSFFRACLDCARDGLVPDGKEAFFDIRSTKVKVRGQGEQWIQKVVYMPMIRGFYKRAVGPRRMLKDWRGDVVCEHDEWELVKGDDERFFHRPNVFGNRGKIIGAYSIAVFHDGTISRDFMGYGDLMKAKAKSPSGHSDKSPWHPNNHEDRMCIKTVAKRHAPRLNLGDDVMRLVDKDNADRDEPEAIAAPAKPKPAAVASQRATARLQDMSNGAGGHQEPEAEDERPQHQQAPQEVPRAPQEPAKRGRPSNAQVEANRAAEAEMLKESTQKRAQPAAADPAPTASPKSRQPSATSQTRAGHQVTTTPANGGVKTAPPSKAAPEPAPEPEGEDRDQQTPAQRAWDQGFAALRADLERRPPREFNDANRFDELSAWYDGYDEAADQAENEAMRDGDEAVDRTYA